MNCPKCNNPIAIKIATKLQCRGGKVLTNQTIVVTVQCESCSHIFQVPVTINAVASFNEDK